MSVSSTTYLRMSSFGISEAHYETLRMFVDGTQVLMVQGQNNGYCQVSTCKMCTVGSAEQVIELTAGTHVLRVTADTLDGLYHKSAYFQLQFASASCSSFSSGTCTYSNTACGSCACEDVVPDNPVIPGVPLPPMPPSPPP